MLAITLSLVSRILLLLQCIQAVVYEECANITPGSYVASKESCSKYIYCAGVNSFEGECFPEHYYDVEQDKCMERELVARCNQKDEEEPTVTKRPTPPTPPTLPPTPAIVTEPGLSILTTADYCPIGGNNTSDIVLPNPCSCAAYILCHKGVAIPLACGHGQHFSAASGRCVPASLVPCPKESPMKCREGIYGFIPHPRSCEYFYYCSNGNRVIHRCPQSYTWHYERRTCVQRNFSLCYHERSQLRWQQPQSQPHYTNLSTFTFYIGR